MDHLYSPWRMDYIKSPRKKVGCVFCEALAMDDSPENGIVYRGDLAFVILNRYPYTSGHLMVLPYKHELALENLMPETRTEMMEMVTKGTRVLGKIYQPQGFNIGINQGEAAGAGIEQHIHIHIVPRWIGDTNFMATVAGTRVVPEAPEITWARVRAAWREG